ncbi:radical SAM protein [Clostridium butyricum]|uniref:radical SAM/SPASM domain-containing protein n=1 Tax=Clostridium butyricum TaxID=1492 RepID=UPI00041519DB|nr:radical SAM protein [Clostridium butyricum]MDU1003445.1 radical SAM protein [Clostridium butyricum]
MDKNLLIKFSGNARFMFNEEEVIICNRLNGLWIKISKECYEILKVGENSKFTVEKLLFALEDDADRKYIEELISTLDSMGVFFEKAVCRKIKEISFAITNRCNLKCSHCIVDASYGKQLDKYDTKTICKFLDKIIKVNPQSIVLTGGEPLIRSDFLIILKHVRDNYHGNITLMTNGTLLNETNINKIIRLVTNIDISIDGADEESCSIVRGAGVFHKVINNIRLLKKNGFDKISISMVLTENNSFYVDEFFKLNRLLGTNPMLRALSYSGRALKNKEILEKKYTLRENYYESKRSIEYRACTCTAGYDQLTIEANGDIFPCNLFVNNEFKIGNIEEIEDINKLFNIRKGEVLCSCVQKFEPERFERCKDCNINYFCWSCLYSMYDIKDNFEERCKYKKELYANIWENDKKRG